MALNPQLICQQINKKQPLVKWTAKYVSIQMYSFENCCFWWAGINIQCSCANLMICRVWGPESCSYFKNVALNFLLLFLKLNFIQVGITFPLRLKLTTGQLLLLFLCKFWNFISYVGGILVTNLFPLLLIDIFWLFSKL